MYINKDSEVNDSLGLVGYDVLQPNEQEKFEIVFHIIRHSDF